MKRPICIGLIFGLFTVGSLCRGADGDLSLPPLETKDAIYTNSITEHFDYYVDILERGYPIGEIKPTGQKGEQRYGSSLEPVVAALQNYSAQLGQAYQDWLRRYQQLASTSPPATPGSDTPAAISGTPARQAVGPLNREGFALFLSCAARTLPDLKSRLQMQFAGNTLELPLLVTRLQSEQGNGRWIGDGGLACGKYLGASAGPSLSTKQDIETLSALLARDGDDRKTLMVAYTLYARARKLLPLQYPLFWDFYWRLVRFASVFSEGPLPTVDEALVSFSNSRKDSLTLQQGKVTMTLSTEGLDRKIRADWAVGESQWQGVIP